jgi:trehalose/maltose hydrolase-like predicted phosphorylase
MRWYAHRSQRSLYVCEFIPTFVASDHVNVTMTNNAGDASEDFVIDGVAPVGDYAHMTCGTTITPETNNGPAHTVCVTSSNIPTAAKALSITKSDSGRVFTYLSAFRTSLDVEAAKINVNSIASASQSDFFLGTKLAHTYPEHVRGKETHELLQSHKDGWAKLWSSGIEVQQSNTRTDIPAAVNASFFAILSSVRDDWAQGLAPGGLTNYYNGHSFWDTETWMYPSLLFLHPTISKVKYLIRPSMSRCEMIVDV